MTPKSAAASAVADETETNSHEPIVRAAQDALKTDYTVQMMSPTTAVRAGEATADLNDSIRIAGDSTTTPRGRPHQQGRHGPFRWQG